MKSPRLKNNKVSSKKGSSSKNSYLADDENFQGFSNQLSKIGLELRDITGDGNCCFRALSDQMEGNESHHLDYRKRVCQYMRQNREEFEPFVAALIDEEETDQSNNKKSSSSNKKLDAFEKYIKNLEQPGTYADNGCLVAFARLYQVNINIHQLNLPIWTINGITGNNKNRQIRELHLSYHNGEHYSSIRPLGDRTNTPTNIFYSEDQACSFLGNSKKGTCESQKNFSNQTKSNSNSKNNHKLSIASNKSTFENYNNNNNSNDDLDKKDPNNFTDLYYLSENLEHLNFDESDINEKIEQIMDITKCNDVEFIKEKLIENNFDTELSINSILMNQQDLIDNFSDNSSFSLNRSNKNNKLDKKQEKKQRQMERQRIKVLEQREKELLANSAQKLKDTKNVKTIDPKDLPSIHQQEASAASASDASGINNNVNLNLNLSNIQTKSI